MEGNVGHASSSKTEHEVDGEKSMDWSHTTKAAGGRIGEHFIGKHRAKTDFCFSVRCGANARDSGGGTRTPDTRIMIPGNDFSKPFSGNGLCRHGSKVCTQVCIQDDQQLRSIARVWHSLAENIKSAITAIVESQT